MLKCEWPSFSVSALLSSVANKWKDWIKSDVCCKFQFNKPTSSLRFFFLIKPSQTAEWEQCMYIYRTLVYSLLAGFAVAVDSVVVLFTFTHSVFLWCTCEQQGTITLFRLNWGNTWATEVMNKTENSFNLLHCQILKLTCLIFLFIRTTTSAFATLVRFWVDVKFVITILTATNSVLVSFTFGYLYIMLWCCGKVKRKKKWTKQTITLYNTGKSKTWNWFRKKGNVTLLLQRLQLLQLGE